MAGIPDATIDEVRAASDLVDVVGERVSLKKQGRRFLGLCPFHSEKSPSFSVIPDEGFYYCFGCKSTGDVFTFVRETEGVGFLDAVRLLAGRAGIALPEETSPAADRQGALHAALRYAAGFYVEQLRGDAGKRARAYLAERQFTREAVLAFGIGYAPDGWDGLATAATAAGFDADTLEAVGLVKRRDNGGIYDVFRDRLVFPILSPIGKVLGFAGRILPDSRQATADFTPAKYLNTPETEIYHKGRVLFGMKQAKRAIRAEGEAVVVEGHADVVALWQAGVEHVVAASGTALTAAQLDLLARIDVKRVVLLFDADAAGQGAARKGIETALDAGLTPYAVSLPDGADPDSFVRTFGADAFRAVLADERRDFVEFLVAGARREGLFETPEGKREAVDRVVSALARVSDPILAEEYVRRAARALDVYEEDLRREIKRYRSTDYAEVRKSKITKVDIDSIVESSGVRSATASYEGELIRLMLIKGDVIVIEVLSQIAISDFTEGISRDVVNKIYNQHKYENVSKMAFMKGDYGMEMQNFVSSLVMFEYDVSDNWNRLVSTKIEMDKNPTKTVEKTINRLKMIRVVEAVVIAKERLRIAEEQGEDISTILNEIVGLNRIQSQFERGNFLTGSEEG